jgi:hypothetical protein
MTRLLPVIVLLALAGCKSSGSRSWYSGPAELKAQTQDAINTALAELPRDVKRPLKWDWSRNRVTVRIVEPTGRVRGWPTVTNPHTGEQVYGYAVGSEITLPRGFERRTLIHECGHVVMYANGFPDWEYHHTLPFFDRY